MSTCTMEMQLSVGISPKSQKQTSVSRSKVKVHNRAVRRIISCWERLKEKAEEEICKRANTVYCLGLQTVFSI